MAADIGCSVPGMGGYNGGRPGAFSKWACIDGGYKMWGQPRGVAREGRIQKYRQLQVSWQACVKIPCVLHTSS